MAGINMLSQVGGDGVYGGYDWGDDADDNNVTTTSAGGSPNKNIAVSIEISEKKHGGANPFDAGESGTATTGDSKKKSQNPFDALTNESEWDNNDKADDPQSYMSIYDELNAGIDEIERNINRIKKLHNQYASIASSSTEAELMKELDSIMSDNGSVQIRVKEQIKAEKSANDKYAKENKGSSIAQWRINQLNTCTRRFKKVSTDFQQKLNEFNNFLKNRQSHLIDIVDTEHKLTNEDKENLAKDPERARQFIQQSFALTDISDEMLTRLEELEQRHDGMQRIQQSMEELHAMWQELHMLITEQQELIDSITHNVQMTKDYVESAVVHIEKAEKHQKSARKLRLYLCALCFVILLIVLISTGAAGGFGKS